MKVGKLTIPLAGEMLPFSVVWSDRNDNPVLRRLLGLRVGSRSCAAGHCVAVQMNVNAIGLTVRTWPLKMRVAFTMAPSRRRSTTEIIGHVGGNRVL